MESLIADFVFLFTIAKFSFLERTLDYAQFSDFLIS